MASYHMLRLASLAFTLGWVSGLEAADSPTAKSPDTPPTVAPTREELKRWLDNSRQSRPRLPLPPPTADEIAKANARPGAAGPMRGIINNARMRQLYLPTEFTSGGFTRTPDTTMSLTSAFKTEIFWIVSRMNNCAYCQGHQEVKLSSEGLSDDQIAALDGDWSDMTPDRQAAFAFVKKMTDRPDLATAEDLEALRKHYKDLQILEILVTLAGNNAMNRWTGSLAIPQEDHRDFLTPTSPKYATSTSSVAPLDRSAKGITCAPAHDRGPLPSREETEKALTAARNRTPRLPLADEEAVRKLVPTLSASEPVPQWARLLANFPNSGKVRIDLNQAAATKGKLSPRLKAEIAWICARNDRAWYALGHAQKRLRASGLTDDQIYGLDDLASLSNEAERRALAVARKITVDPARISNADIAGLRQVYSDREVAEIVFHATEGAFIDRITESAGLRLED